MTLDPLSKLEKDILAGKYKDQYLTYGRRSDKDPNNQKNSLNFQKKQAILYAKQNSLSVALITIPGFCTDGVISEKHSGFEEDDEFTVSAGGQVTVSISRPKFRRLIGYLSRGLFKGVLVLCYDRISRNSTDGALVKKLIRQGTDIRFVWAKYEKNASGSMHMNADQMFAQHHAENTSEKVRETIEEVRSQGKVTNRAPVGYLNEGNMDWKPFDTARAPIIKRMFVLAAEDWSLSDIAQWANEQGFTMPPQRRKRSADEMLMDEDDEDAYFKNTPKVERLVTAAGVHKILTNKFYIGLTHGNDGAWVPSVSHEAMVDTVLFDQVQLSLQKRKVSVHYADKMPLSHRGLVRCGCGRVYTPYPKKGINYLYSRCKKDCTNTQKSITAAELEKAIGDVIKQLVFTEDEKTEIDARTSTDIALLDNKRQAELDRIDRRKRKVREDIAYIGTNKLTLLRSGAYTPEDLLAEESKLTAELNQLQTQEAASDTSMSQVIQEAIKLSELLDNVAAIYDFAESSEKESIIRAIFSELTMSEKTLQFQCKNAFKALESRFLPTCDPTGIRTPI
jgi:site-specific DNA recombinase